MSAGAWCSAWPPAAATRGAAYRVSDADWAETYAYLREREQPTETYVEGAAWVRLADGRRVETLVFLSDRSHPHGPAPFPWRLRPS